MSGETIRTEREARGWTLRDFAKLTQVSRQTLMRIELGQVEASDNVERRIDSVLGVGPQLSLFAEQPKVELSDERLLEILRDRVRRIEQLLDPEDDVTAYVVAVHPDGLELEEIAVVMGTSLRSIVAAQTSAIEKLHAACSEDSADGRAARAWVERIAEVREAREERNWLWDSADDQDIYADGEDDEE